MSSPLYLGIDVGTQGVKALLLDPEQDAVVGRGAHPLELLPSSGPGSAEQDPADWIHGLRAAVRQALDDALDSHGSGVRSRVCGIGVSGQQHGFVPLDANDRVLRPARLWCDTATASEAAELAAAWGRPLPAGFTASKILWLKRHEPDNFAALRWVLLPHDYCNLWLCGEKVAERGDASGTGLLCVAEGDWDRSAAAVIDPTLPDRLPPLVAPDRWIGTLLPRAAEELGLPPGIPIAPGSGDNMMSALGAGAVEEGILVVSLGTSGTLFGRSETPVVDSQGQIASFCDAMGGWLPLLCTMNCTTVVEEVREAFGLDHQAATKAAAAEPAGCAGLTLLPYLAGERAPNWPQASGVLYGIRAGDLTPGKLYRAALEGASFALYLGATRFLELGLPLRELRVVGGGAANPLWRRTLANLFQTPLRFPVETESAALGGARQAWAIDAGEQALAFLRAHPPRVAEQGVEPETAQRAPLQEAFERFRALGQRLFG